MKYINEIIEIVCKTIVLVLIVSNVIIYTKPSNTNDIIFNKENIPSEKEIIKFNSIKGELISDINSTNNIDKFTQEKLKYAINDIKFIVVSSEDMKVITNDDRVIACYFKNLDVKSIIINKQKLRYLSTTNVIIHELRHLVDDVLVDDKINIDKTYYSKSINIIKILDKDIISQNKIGKKKLKNKINFYTEKMIEFTNGKFEYLNDNDKKAFLIKEDIYRKYIESLFDDNDNNRYLTSPSEIYVRFHGLKRWMIKNKYLKDMNDKITQEKIINILNDPKIINEYDHDLDFFELLFFLNIDFTGKVPNNMKKINSII